MTADKLRRASTWLLAAGVAAIAAIVSYSHIFDLGREHGGSGTAARLLPLSVDMLILVGELMLLHEGDRRDSRFWLGWGLVWSGILATLAANVTYGAQFGAEGAVIWGWPAYSFILVAAGMVAIVKRAGAVAAPLPATAPAPPVFSTGSDDLVGAPDDLVAPSDDLVAVPDSSEAAAEASLRATLAAGNPWSITELAQRFSLTRHHATKLRARVLAEANGQHPQETVTDTEGTS